ncbi:MAG: restriction endonuclease [Candidatus Aenigmarchaeota archaeon]|nr:restriction endonuclease [Candidatus Aenigmarchaeota archaeon]
MFVLKADGRKEEFSQEKIVRTCVRSGVAPDMARSIAKKIAGSVQNGMTTHKIYTMILAELDMANGSSIFMLREAIANLDPISFELYVKKVLEAHGYRCMWNKLIKGMNVEHQVDVIANKERSFLVECKRHFNPHRFTGLNICLQVEARLNDIMLGSKNGKNNYKFDAAWVVTNTKFSDHAKMYAKGVGIRLTGWRYDEEFALEKLVQAKKVLPVTILKTDVSVQRGLLNKKILTLQDLIREKPKIGAKDLISQANSILSKLGERPKA